MYKSLEQGRSMIEMLGMPAIIGITVGESYSFDIYF